MTYGPMHCSTAMRHERGLSLIELMIAMLISLMILGGLTQIFSMNRKTYQSDEGIARLQENARFAIDFLTRDLRSAGAMGCLSINRLKDQTPLSHNKIEDLTGGAVNVSALFTPVQGYDASDIPSGTTAFSFLPATPLYPPTLVTATNPPLDSTLAPTGGIVGASDAIVIRAMDQEPTGFVAPPAPNELYVASNSPIASNQIILTTDCSNASINKVLSKSTTGTITTLSINPSSKVLDQYQAQVATLRTMLYYIGPGSGGGPSLFSRNFSDGIGTPQELVEGVETMQLLYGIDTGCAAPGDTRGTACTYQQASSAIDWKSVRSVRIALLVASSNVVTTRDYDNATNAGGMESSVDSNTYDMQGITFTPNPDRRRRRVFETTVGIRSETVPAN